MLTVPEAAVLRDAGGAASVWIVTRAGDTATVARHPVTLGDAAGGRVTVTAGLNTGAEIVTRGVNSLTDGQAVGRRVAP